MCAATVSSAADHDLVVDPDRIAVIAHSGKTLDGGLGQLRADLAAAHVPEPRWYEVPKSKMAPKRVRTALDAGAELLFVWGGDGMVQRCVDAAAGSEAAVAIIPAGTANLFASNLGIPKDVRAAVDVGLHGSRRRFDLGKINGEHFAVMAGAGMDALMIRDADGALKNRFGRAAYVLTGARRIGIRRVATRVRLDGDKWFDGKASCVLIGNVGRVMGNIPVFPGGSPTDGLLDIGIVTAEGRWQWTRTLARTAFGKGRESPFVEVARGRKIEVRFSKSIPYELDGGDRKATRRLQVKVKPEAVTICVPRSEERP
jgi:YegS/Rv2252/BmrU family lipid kinase